MRQTIGLAALVFVGVAALEPGDKGTAGNAAHDVKHARVLDAATGKLLAQHGGALFTPVRHRG